MERNDRIVSTSFTYSETCRGIIQSLILQVKYSWFSDYTYITVELLMWI